jgi:hypothetical protein
VSQINIYHASSLPEDEQNEITEQNNARRILYSPYIKCKRKRQIVSANKFIGGSDKYSSEEFKSTQYKRNYWDLTGGDIELPDVTDLYQLIRSEYVDDQYRFNISNQPVTTRSPNKNTVYQDNMYLKHIHRDIQGWNELFYKYYQDNRPLIDVNDLRPTFVMETSNEFLITVYCKIKYIKTNIFFELKYYGQITRSGEFLNGGSDTYILQLVRITPISNALFDNTPLASHREEDNVFMTMKSQMKYVDRIDKMHANEYNFY